MDNAFTDPGSYRHHSTDPENRLIEHLFERLREARNAERAAISRELHDSVSRNLTGLSLILARLRRELDHQPPHAEGSKRAVDDALVLVEEISSSVRNVMAELRMQPDVESDLATALIDYVELLTERTPLRIDVNVPALPIDLPQTVKVVLMQIAQEALTNVIQHAEARHVILSLTHKDALVRLRVQDDGCGFCLDGDDLSAKGSYGLLIMTERAASIGATLTIESRPGQGTRITVETSQ
jgi:signal transduction histidine kinase